MKCWTLLISTQVCARNVVQLSNTTPQQPLVIGDQVTICGQSLFFTTFRCAMQCLMTSDCEEWRVKVGQHFSCKILNLRPTEHPRQSRQCTQQQSKQCTQTLPQNHTQRRPQRQPGNQMRQSSEQQPWNHKILTVGITKFQPTEWPSIRPSNDQSNTPGQSPRTAPSDSPGDSPGVLTVGITKFQPTGWPRSGQSKQHTQTWHNAKKAEEGRWPWCQARGDCDKRRRFEQKEASATT